jgi:ubiquinone/menaquinone biosynthesis C-methylase UbiE
MQTPLAMGHYAIYDTVESILSAEPRGKLLDVPAGEGALAVRLRDMGFEVSCCDLYPQIFKVEDLEIKGGNMDRELPYGDDEFDHIVCVEGLEHIENPANAIREFARIVKPGGQMIISVPNIMNIEERLKWLFSGYTSHFKPLSAQALRDHKHHEMEGLDEIALHINPIGYAEVRYLLEKSGFELVRTFRDKSKSRTWLFAPLTAMITLVSRFTSKTKREARWTDELNSPEVLRGGNTLIFLARKT